MIINDCATPSRFEVVWVIPHLNKSMLGCSRVCKAGKQCEMLTV